MKIVIGSDHAGYAIKKAIVSYLQSNGIIVKDIGTFSEEPVDYPDFAHLVATLIQNKVFDFGILICGSGIGMSIVANRYPGVRAALCFNTNFAELARKHNNANVICLPGRFLTPEDAIAMIDTFLKASFEGGRHQNRVNKIDIC